MIVLNLKTYEQSLEKSLLFTDIAGEIVEETGVRVIVCPPSIYLIEAAERFSDVYAQHVDPNCVGAFTGSLPLEALKYSKIKGSLVNHSEKKLELDTVKAIVEGLHNDTLESIVCADSVKEAEKVAEFTPSYIAIEPPELIGSGVSVSNSKPELVENTVKRIKQINNKIPVLCGAGVSNRNDVQKALELGAEGVLLASAFVKSRNPKEFLKDLASVF